MYTHARGQAGPQSNEGLTPLMCAAMGGYAKACEAPTYILVLFYTILYQYDAMLYYSELYYSVLCYTILHYTILYHTILYRGVRREGTDRLAARARVGRESPASGQGYIYIYIYIYTHT